MGYKIRFENSNYLCHKSHKYIDKKWSNGRWNYIYEGPKGDAARLSNARDESRRANYEARKANEELATATANRQYQHKRENPAVPYGSGKMADAKWAENKASSNAQYKNYRKDRAHERLEEAKKDYDGGIAHKAAKSMEQAISKGKDIANKILCLPFMAAFAIGYTYNKNHPH